jgi:hypothetical protein
MNGGVFSGAAKPLSWRSVSGSFFQMDHPKLPESSPRMQRSPYLKAVLAGIVETVVRRHTDQFRDMFPGKPKFKVIRPRFIDTANVESAVIKQPGYGIGVIVTHGCRLEYRIQMDPTMILDRLRACLHHEFQEKFNPPRT